MESLASRTNVASLRAGSTARPASHLNRGRAAPVAVRASGADDDGNNKTSSAVAGACPSPERAKNRKPRSDGAPRSMRLRHRDRAARTPSRRPSATDLHPAHSFRAQLCLGPTRAPDAIG